MEQSLNICIIFKLLWFPWFIFCSSGIEHCYFPYKYCLMNITAHFLFSQCPDRCWSRIIGSKSQSVFMTLYFIFSKWLQQYYSCQQCVRLLVVILGRLDIIILIIFTSWISYFQGTKFIMWAAFFSFKKFFLILKNML